jgi:hypothetical protein
LTLVALSNLMASVTMDCHASGNADINCTKSL